MKFLLLVFTVLGFCILALGQSPTPQSAIPIPGTGIQDWINTHLATIASVGGFILTEVLLRALPTQKPVSWLYGVSTLLKWVATLSETISKALDGILQN